MYRYRVRFAWRLFCDRCWKIRAHIITISHSSTVYLHLCSCPTMYMYMFRTSASFILYAMDYAFCTCMYFMYVQQIHVQYIVYTHLQVLLLIEFVNEFLSNNPFVVCSEELNHIKRELAREGDTLKVKHKTGAILFRACQGRSVFIMTCAMHTHVQHVHVRTCTCVYTVHYCTYTCIYM